MDPIILNTKRFTTEKTDEPDGSSYKIAYIILADSIEEAEEAWRDENYKPQSFSAYDCTGRHSTSSYEITQVGTEPYNTDKEFYTFCVIETVGVDI